MCLFSLQNIDSDDIGELALVVCPGTVCVCLVCKMDQMCFLFTSRLTWLSFPGGEYEYLDHEHNSDLR